MLVLTRNAGEFIMVGDDVKLTVLHGSHVKVGIEAPTGVRVHRGEVWKRIQQGREPERRRPLPGVMPDRVPLTKAQLEHLVIGRTGEQAWWLDRTLNYRWLEYGEHDAIAELAAEVLELRGRLRDVEKRRTA